MTRNRKPPFADFIDRVESGEIQLPAIGLTGLHLPEAYIGRKPTSADPRT